MKSFTAFITEAISSQTVAKPDPNKDEADMTVLLVGLIHLQLDMKNF